MTEWDEYAAGWDDSPEVRAYAGAAFSSLCSLTDGSGFGLAGTKVCDFGCGTGLLTERLVEHSARIDGVDPSEAMRGVLEAKIERHRWDRVRVLGELPAVPQQYDLVVCSSVLAFVDDYPGMVRTLYGHLRPGGLFVQWDWELNPDDDEPFGLAAEGIRRTLGDAGFDDVTVGIGFEVPVEGDTMRPLMGHGRRPS